jgi:general secretion pathway protein G
MAMTNAGDRRGQAGFTLVELVVVVIVVGIVGAIAIFSLASAMDKARQRDTVADMRDLAQAIERYKAAHQTPPPDEKFLRQLIREAQASSPVSDLRDHWSNDYRYRGDLAGNYTLESFGKDGLDGPDITLASRFDFDRDIVLVNGAFVAAPE